MKTSFRHSIQLGPAAFLLGSALSLLAGCGGSTAPVASVTTQTMHMTGSLHGGQQPVSGAQVYLYATATYTGGASTSLLTTGTGYVTSGTDGSFNITGDYTCPAADSNGISPPTYLLALGGNSGYSGTSTNSAIALMATLGPCSGLSSSTFVQVNELSTAAAVTALQQFITDGTHIGATNSNVQTGYAAPPNIANAMVTVNNLYDMVHGIALSAPVGGNGVSPALQLNLLGDILAACINSAGPSSMACSALFTATTPSGGTAPTNTLAAMLQIAKNPGTNVASLMALSSSSAPFQPTPSTTPNDLSLAISYTTPTLTNPGQLGFDTSGNVWIANCASCVSGSTGADAVVGLSPAGARNSTNANYILNVHKPLALAVDQYNHVWVAEGALGALGNQVTQLSNTDGSVASCSGTNNFPVTLGGTPGGIALNLNNYPAYGYVTDTTDARIYPINCDGTQGTLVGTTGLGAPTAITADGLGNVYLVGNGSSNIVQYNTKTSAFTTLTGAAGQTSPMGVAADGGDHVWATNSNGSVSELLGYTGAATSGSTGYSTGLTRPGNVSIDGAGTAWIANCRASCGGTGADQIVHLSTTGASALASAGLQSKTLATPTYSAIDTSGNLWISNSTGASVSEFVGVAAPVVISQTAAAGLHALGAVNYLVNPGFNNGAAGATIPGWTTTNANAKTDNGSPFEGTLKLTFYGGAVTTSQTINGLATGRYLVSCYAAHNGDGGTSSLSAVSGGTTSSTNITDGGYNFLPYSVADVAVTAGSSLTVNLSTTGTGYIGWDGCSVTRE